MDKEFSIGDIVIVKRGSDSSRWVDAGPQRVMGISSPLVLRVDSLSGHRSPWPDGFTMVWRDDCVLDPFLNGAVKAIAALKEGKNGKEK